MVTHNDRLMNHFSEWIFQPETSKTLEKGSNWLSVWLCMTESNQESEGVDAGRKTAVPPGWVSKGNREIISDAKLKLKLPKKQSGPSGQQQTHKSPMAVVVSYSTSVFTSNLCDTLWPVRKELEVVQEWLLLHLLYQTCVTQFLWSTFYFSFSH